MKGDYDATDRPQPLEEPRIMATYRTVPKEVNDLVDKVVNEYHPDLEEAGVTVSALFADEVRSHGWPCAAIIELNSKKNRVKGMDDATVTIDENHWKDLSEEKRIGLLDHELEHLELQCDEEGKVKTDDANRPKLKIRPHDWEGGFFYKIVERHKEAAPEAASYKPLHQKMTQLCFPWG
jgi:hypothetical protein